MNSWSTRPNASYLSSIGLCLLLVLACDRKTESDGGERESGELFVDMAVQSGLDFTHFNGMSGEFYIAEIMGAGCALFDYDGDGDLDVYLVQGNLPGPGKTMADALFPNPEGLPLRDRLFRNDLTVGAGGVPQLSFTDVTDQSGLRATGYGMGVTAGDYDNDGAVDLYITNLGPNQLYRNKGDGTFEDVTARTGAGEPRWSVSAAFVDIDNDGWLDLYIGNYLDFQFETHRPCFKNGKEYCHPLTYAPLSDRLLRNRGNGQFEDITQTSGLAARAGNGLGVVSADFDGNGFLDLYVANDGQANFLWMNEGNGRFREMALLSGCALNEEGEAEASMGIDAADFDGDGDEDLFMTHLTGETNTLYVNEGGLFVDQTIQAGLGPASKGFTGFGTAWFDYDHDGRLDLLIANGAVTTIVELRAKGDPFPLHQKNQLFRGLGGGRYKEISATAGEVFQLSEVSRGAAFGDIDNDGDIDVLVTNNNGRARLLQNRVGNQRPWLGVRLLGTGERQAISGARVGLFRPGLPVMWRRARRDASYASANDPRVHFGLGESAAIDKIRVHWPGGDIEEWRDLAPHRWHTIQRGTGAKVLPANDH